MTLFIHELKLNGKALLIWSLCAGFTCFGCIWLFAGLRDSMEQMARAYGQMGAFSTALGLVMFVFTCIVAFSVLRVMAKEEE